MIDPYKVYSRKLGVHAKPSKVIENHCVLCDILLVSLSKL